MLQRPTRPLPRQFNRNVSKNMRNFVERRHKRQQQYKRERWNRFMRRVQRSGAETMRTLRRWLWVAVGGGSLLVVAVLLFSPLVRVRTIQTPRTDTRLDIVRVQRALIPMFGKHLLFLTSREVETLVKGAVPDVSTVSMEKQFPSTLTVTVTLHPLVARLLIDRPQVPTAATGTGASALIAARAPTYDYLTDNGLYVSLSSAAAPLPAIRLTDWAVRPIPSMLLITPDFLKRMRDTELALQQQFGLKITGRTVYLRGREYHIETPKFSLWFDVRAPLPEQLQRLRVFQQNVGWKGVKEYVDLRLTARVVYK
jgi:cell division septal protein FtsQ